MFWNVLFTMSYAGSVVVLLYLLVYPLAKRYFPLVWRYRILKMALFFYLIPVSKWKYRLIEVFRMCFPKLWDRIYREPDFRGAYSIVMENGWMRWSPGIYQTVFLLILCGMISALAFFRFILQDRKLKTVYRAGSENLENQELQRAFSQVRQELCMKRRVKLKCSAFCQSPVTYGLFFPVVYMPFYVEKEMDRRALRYIFRHELLHIKRNDLLVRYLGLLAMALHWFNPFSYFLFRELSDIGEMYCDSGVLEQEGEDGRKKYGELLIQMAVRKAPDTKYSFFVGMAGSRQHKIIKRRIMEMKKGRKKQIVLSMAVMIFIGMAGGMTTFAYEPPQIVCEIGNDRIEDNQLLYDGMAPDGWYLGDDEKPEVISWDDYFTDDTGCVTEVSEQDLSGRAGCRHDYRISGTYSSHVKNGSGGCTVTEYEARKCSLCGAIQKGNITNVITYQKCPH